MHEATVAREYGKFVFTRSVSDMLELIAEFSLGLGLTRDQISHVPLSEILSVIKNSSHETMLERFSGKCLKDMKRCTKLA